jgi:hypothetical protein
VVDLIHVDVQPVGAARDLARDPAHVASPSRMSVPSRPWRTATITCFTGLAEVVGLDDRSGTGRRSPSAVGTFTAGGRRARAHAHTFALHDARAVDVLADDVERRAVLG